MQVKTELRPMFSYNIILIIIAILLIIIAVFLKLFLERKSKTKNIKEIINTPTKAELTTIKSKYLKEIEELSKTYEEGHITSRKAYQKLSSIIRNFIFESTNIKVQNYTLKEIKKINIPILYELVSEYYNPKFASSSNGNIILSINKTKVVIEKWN